MTTYEYPRTELQSYVQQIESCRGIKPKQAQNALAGLLGFSNWHDLRKSARLGMIRSKVSPEQLALRLEGVFEIEG